MKNEYDLDDATARNFAKRALNEFRSIGSEAVTRTSVLCNNDTTVNCDSTSKFRTIEGTCNNLDKPFLGAFHAQFIREIAVEPYDALSIIISDPDIGTYFFTTTFVFSENCSGSVIIFDFLMNLNH